MAHTPETMAHEHAPAVPSTVLHIVGAGLTPVHLRLADLQALPQVSVQVHNAHDNAEESYSGPLVTDVLAKAGLSLSAQTQRQMLESAVLAEGTDGYFVVFSAAELQPALHKAQAIVAIAQSGQPLTRTGAFQLVDPLDVKPARWVRNLTQLDVVLLHVQSPGAASGQNIPSGQDLH